MGNCVMTSKIEYKAGYKYQLSETTQFKTHLFPNLPAVSEYMTLFRDGVLVIREGYAWDGPSGPTIDTKSFMRGSLAHDALYQLMRENKLTVHDARKKADQVLRKICLEDGMWKIRAWWVYKGVRFGAENSSINGREVITAP